MYGPTYQMKYGYAHFTDISVVRCQLKTGNKNLCQDTDTGTALGHPSVLAESAKFYDEIS